MAKYHEFYWKIAMRKKESKVRKVVNRLSFRWVVVCMSVILPLNILTAVFCVLIYHNYRDSMLEVYQNQLNDFADDIATEMNEMIDSLTVYFSTEAVNIIAGMAVRDPSITAVALKKALGIATTGRNVTGFCFEWDVTNDIISVFNINYKYLFAEQEQIKEKLCLMETGKLFDSEYYLVSIKGHTFLGCNYQMQQFVLGMYIDLGSMMAEYCKNSLLPEDILGLADGNNILLCSYSGEGFSNEPLSFRKDHYSIYLESLLPFQDFKMVLLQENGMLMKSAPMFFYLLLILTVLSFGMIPLIYWLSDRMLIAPLKEILSGMRKVSCGDFSVRVPVKADTIDIRVLNQGFNSMVSEIDNLTTKVYEKEIQRLKAEAINLKLQVNPHMFLNSLNTIYSLGRLGKNEQVCELSALLSKYFRYLLRSDAEFATVKEEISFVESYLKIQKIRYPNRFCYMFAVEEAAEEVHLPRLLIQNFVENTVKYGIIPGQEIEIIVNIHMEDDRLIMAVIDTGQGIEENMLKQIQSDMEIQDEDGKHTGIWNARRRMSFYYQDQYEFSISSRPREGTQVWISIPAEKTE